MENNVEQKTIEKTTESIEKILNDGLNTNNLENLYKLSKIKHMAKEDKEMMNNYGNYGGRRAGYDTYGRDNYGNYGNYGARGYDMRYRGHDYIDRMSSEYGRYEDNRQRYGANNQEVDKSHHYMMESLKDFISFLYENAETPQQKQDITQALQTSMR